MLVQCPECSTKYNLNEAQIAPEGSKVRCVRCKNVFTAFRPQAEEPAPAAPAPARPETPVDRAAEQKASPSGDAATAPGSSLDDDLDRLLAGTSAPVQPQASNVAVFEDDLDRALTDAPRAEKSGAGQPGATGGGGAFEDELEDLLAGATNQFDAPSALSTPQASSFEDELDDIFAGKKDALAPEPSSRPAAASTASSFEDDLDRLFAEKSATPATPAAQTRSPLASAFGDELGELFAEKAKSLTAPASPKEDMVAELEGAFQQPLIAKTRRDDLLDDEPKAVKKSGRFGLIVTILLLLIVATGAGIYFKFIWLPAHEAAPNATVQAPATGATPESPAAPVSAAQIALENVRQYFVPNEKEGQLFIIEGKAVNHFPEPKELLRLKATLYDKQGKVVTAQEFMCGNVVTLYQLQVSSRQDIETALGAKVGILAHNTNVQPGASVPFMVVFFGAPETVEEFGLEVMQTQSPQ